MKLFLVKGDEKIEVTRSEYMMRYYVLAEGVLLSYEAAEALGYKLIEEELERRECWVRLDDAYTANSRANKPDSDESWYKVFEVKEGEKILSREEIEKAWSKTYKENWTKDIPVTLNRLLAELGYDDQ